jgi:DNA-binding NarL/FixJ family response regulator
VTVNGGSRTRVRVVLVDDSAAGPRTADALAGGGAEVLGRTAVPAEAVSLVVERCPQVVVVDLDAGPAALTAVGSVAAAAPEIPILALTAVADHTAVLASVRAGATSHLVAPGPVGELADAVRRTADGEAVFSPGLADIVLREFGRPLGPQEGARRLTGREADVLRLIVEGLTARQIAARLVLSPRTVENHVQNMLRKLALNGRAALVRYAIEQGLA